MEKECMVCGVEFEDGDEVAAVMLSTFKRIDSDSSFAVTHPTKCLEIVHIGCYDGELPEDQPVVDGIN